MALKIDIPTREQRQASNPATSVWVAANAGSGKTHVLVDRVIRLMLEDAEPETILCLTFTKAAAAEMQARLFERLGQWALASDDSLSQALAALGVENLHAADLAKARRLFTRALETPGGLKIQTIHAFAERLLKLFPVEAGIAPDFEVLEDRKAAELLDLAKRTILMRAQLDAQSEEAAAMARVEPYCSSSKFEKLLDSLIDARQLVSALAPGSSLQVEQLYFAALGFAPTEDLESLARRCLSIDAAAFAHMAAVLQDVGDHKGFHAGRALQAVLNAPGEAAALAALRYFAVTKSKSTRRSDTGMLSVKVARANPDLLTNLLGVRDKAFDDLAAYDLAVRAQASAALVWLAGATHHLYASAKKAKGVYDFNDLIGLAAGLLGSRASAQWVLYKIDKGLDHILVDEAQDTSPGQWRIVQALTEEFFAGAGARQDTSPGKARTLFVVGDRKQSIYSFQGADVRSFEAVRHDFAARIRAAGQDFPDVRLQLSYRSVQTILSFVDTVFPSQALAALGFASSGSTGDIADDNAHTASRKDKGLVQVWPLVSTIADETERDPNSPVDEEADESHRRRLARMLAATIKSWIGHRQLSGSKRAVQPGDIMVLFKRRSTLFNMLISELRQAGVPVAGADRLTLKDSLAVMDLVMLLQHMVLPEDDHALACILKSPLVPAPLTDDELTGLAQRDEQQSLWQRLSAATDEKLREDFSYLQDLSQRHESAGLYEFIARVLARARKAMLARLGPESLDATDAFLDNALDFEMQHGPSVTAFLAWFLADDNEIKREMEKSAGLVRLMTVHGSKGLEAPVVILADAAAAMVSRHDDIVIAPDNHPAAGLPLWKLSGLIANPLVTAWEAAAKQRTAEEHARLLYVAMTRARDELYICGSAVKGVPPDDSWYAILQAALRQPNALSEVQEVALDGLDQPALHFGVPHVWYGTAHDEHTAVLPLPGWLAQPAAVQPPMLVGTNEADHSVGDIDSILEIHRQDPRIAQLLAASSDRDVDWAARLDGGQVLSGGFKRLAITPSAITALLCCQLPEDPRTAGVIKAAVAALRQAYPGRQIMTGLLTLQTGALDWFEDKDLQAFTAM